MSKHFEPPPPAWVQGASPWLPDGASIDAAFAAYERWMDGWWQAQDGSLRFYRTCLARSIDAAESLAASKSPLEAFEVQMRFAGDALNDCLDEGRRMLALAGEAAPPHAAPVKRNGNGRHA